MFVRKVDRNLARLAKALDEAVAKYQSKRLCAFIVVLTDDAEATEKALRKLADKHGISYVPLTYIEGPPPASYNISPDAEVTVLTWKAVKVVKSRGFSSTKDLTKKTVASIVNDAKALLE